MNRRIELLRKDLIEKIHEILNIRCQFWKRAEFANTCVYQEQFYVSPESITLETLCDFLDALDGIIPLRLVD
jgi:hypothetical protein